MAKTIFEEMGGKYERQGDYLIPCLTVPAEEEQPIGIWGQRHLDYLKHHCKVTYTNLLTSGRLNAYLADIDRQAQERFERLIEGMKQAQGITEQLKAENALEWTGCLNNIRACAREIVEVALTQLGNEGGQPYWSWYGFDGRVEWCACFVSWCADQCSYIESGIIPKFAGCVDGANWFKGNGQWKDRSYEPSTGDIIFFDWEGDGETDHVGIVEKCENGVVYTVEGNSGDACRQKQYTVGSSSIYGYGVPAY